MKRLIAGIREYFQRRQGWPPSQSLKMPKMTAAERRGLIRNLVDHPGYRYLMAEIEDKKAAQEKLLDSLTRRIPPTVAAEVITRDIIKFNEAIYWLGWIQDKVARANAKPELTEYAREGRA